MPVDQSLVGRTFPPTRPQVVSEEAVRDFVAAWRKVTELDRFDLKK